MSDKLQKFVGEHRQEFDSDTPGKDLLDRIDARMELKDARISSKWLSRFKYLGFSASVLALALYLVGDNLPYQPASEVSPATQQPVTGSKPDHKTERNIAERTATDPATTKNAALPGLKNDDRNVGFAQQQKPPQVRQTEEELTALNETPVETAVPAAKESEPENNGEITANAANARPGADRAAAPEKTKIYLPEEPQEMNTYVGTLYDAPAFKSMLGAYKFPGRVKLDKGGGVVNDQENYRTTLKTTSSQSLGRIPGMKAVWLKGRTDKGITVSVKKQFRNIRLVKPDGRQLRPDAISHYYPGLGVISDFDGRYFSMEFKDKVELILFFKDAEEGDRIVIGSSIEAVVRTKP